MCVDPVSIAAAGTAIAGAASSAATAVGTAATAVSASSLGTALSIGSSVAGFVGKQAEADSYNQSVYNSARSASQAASMQYDDAQRRYVYDRRSTQKEGYDATMRGRTAAATGLASSADAGIAGHSVSLENLIAGEQQKTAENVSRVSDKQGQLLEDYNTATKGPYTTAQNRISSTPLKEGPSALGLALQLGGTAVKFGEKEGWFSNPNPKE